MSTNRLSRYQEELQDIPPSGGGGCHTALLRIANYGRLAGLDADRVAHDLASNVHGDRPVAACEILAAVEKAFNHRSKTSSSLKLRTPTLHSLVDGKKLLAGIEARGADFGEVELWETVTQTGGDEEARDMKVLFRLSHDRCGLTRVELKKIIQLIEDGGAQLFSWLNLSEREGQTKLGKMLRRYDGRVLDGLVLKVHSDTTRPKFSFESWQRGINPSSNPTDFLLKVAEIDQGADVADVLHPKSVLTTSGKHDAGVEVEEAVGNERVKVRNVSEVRSAQNLAPACPSATTPSNPPTVQ